MFVIVCCDPEEYGADSVRNVHCGGSTLEETLDILSEMRDDDPDYGNGYTYMEVV